MKIVINEVEYTALTGLRFEPETDLSGNTVPINEFQCDIITDSNDITFGKWAELRDDLDNLWARYWLIYAERINRDTVRIIGQSPLVFLDRVIMPPKMYNTTADDILEEIMASIGAYGQEGDIIEDTTVEDAFANLEVVGFCPEQTARERLQWLLLCTGGYIKSFFDTVLRIKMIDSADGVLIPINRTFWKPSLTYRDYVTEVKVDYYTFTSGTPSSTDEYVTDGTNYWIAQRGQMSVTNTNAPQGAPENVVYIEGVTLISHDLAYGVLYHLVDYYFNRAEIEADVINNAEYMPGQRVFVYTEEDKIHQAYINRASFKFGVQARSSLHLTGAEAVEIVKLTILYKWGNVQVAKRVMSIPKDYLFETTTDYLDWTYNGHRYVFRPTAKKVSVTIQEDSTVTVNVVIALDYFSQGSTRDIYDNQENEVLALLGQYYEGLISKASGNKKNRLRAEYRDRVDTIRNAYHAQMVDMDVADKTLYIVNADGLELDGVEVVDEDSIPTVYIDGDNRTDSGGDTPQPEPDPEPGAVTLTQIYLSAYPTKTTYIQGDALDLTGVAITARYSNGTSADVTSGCTFYPGNGVSLMTAGTQTISVTYTDGEITKDTTFSLTVQVNPNVKTLVDIAITQQPTKKNYVQGEPLDLTGMVVTAEYSNGTYEDVTSQCTSVPMEGIAYQSGHLSVKVYFTANDITEMALIDDIYIAPLPKPSIPDYHSEPSPSQWTFIMASEFRSDSTVTSAIYPSVSWIGSTAFDGCSNLTTASFPACLSMDTAAFRSCYKLSTASFPLCTDIGTNAFYRCSSLQTVYMPSLAGVPTLAFASCSNLSSITVPAISWVETKAFDHCGINGSYDFPALIYILSSGFTDCSIQGVSASNLIYMERDAFMRCHDLASINFPQLRSIARETFLGCWSLAYASIPSVVTIDDYAFAACSALASISLPSVTEIGYAAFSSCHNLSQVYLPGSAVAKLGSYAFNETPIADSSYLGDFGSVYVPSSLLNAYKAHSGWSVYSERIVGI